MRNIKEYHHTRSAMHAPAADDAGAGAVSAEHPTNPRVVRETRGQRVPRPIRIENYGRCDADAAPSTSAAAAAAACSSDARGLLPGSAGGSRESTPRAEAAAAAAAEVVAGDTDCMTFFSGNPFVEVTKGIIHMYKQK